MDGLFRLMVDVKSLRNPENKRFSYLFCPFGNNVVIRLAGNRLSKKTEIIWLALRKVKQRNF